MSYDFHQGSKPQQTLIRSLNTEMECVNCGKMGHSFRECTEPVLSFGVIAVKFIDNEPYYLLIRRRDSLSYVEFLRGKY